MDPIFEISFILYFNSTNIGKVLGAFTCPQAVILLLSFSLLSCDTVCPDGQQVSIVKSRCYPNPYRHLLSGLLPLLLHRDVSSAARPCAQRVSH